VRVGVAFGGSDEAVPGSRVEGAAKWAAKSIFFKFDFLSPTDFKLLG